MEHEVIRSALGWRVAITAIGAALLAGVGVNALRMIRGDWTWDGKGIGIAVGLGLLVVLAVAGVALMWTTSAYVDQRERELHFSSLGRHEVRSLDGETTVQIRRKDALPTGVLVQQEVLVRTPGQSTVTMTTPFLGDVAALARQLQSALAANPGLAADEHTRARIEDPELIARPRG